MRLTIAILLLMYLNTRGQEIKVEYSKKTDFSKYKTFCFGEGLVVAQSTLRQVSDVTFSNWIINGVVKEFEKKNMTQVDSLGDVEITYALIRTAQLDVETTGPLGMTPGSNDRTWSRNFTESTLIIDVNDRSNLLIWRVKANFDVSGPNSESTIDAIVGRGFKKFRRIKKKK